MKKNIQENDAYAFEEIPAGFIKMKMGLTFKVGKESRMVEEDILKMLVRDYYVLYSKSEKFDGQKVGGDKWAAFDFYCRPEDEALVAYNFGIYLERIRNNENDPGIKNAIHRVPDGFPGCIRVRAQGDKIIGKS